MEHKLNTLGNKFLYTALQIWQLSQGIIIGEKTVSLITENGKIKYSHIERMALDSIFHLTKVNLK